MKKELIKKSKPRIIFLVVGMNIFTVFLILFLLYYIGKIKETTSENYTQLFNDEISRMIDLESKQIISVMETDANWDAFVTYTKIKDNKWYDEMYSDVKAYKSDYFGVYGLDNKIINQTNSPKIKVKDFIPVEALRVLNKTKKSRFFLETQDGLIEVFGITITDSDFINTTPKGYFFIARKVDNELIKNFEKITNSVITIVDNPKSKEIEEFKLYYKADLKNHQGKVISTVYFERPFGKYIKVIFKIIIGCLIVVFLFLIVSVIFAKQWVYKPLSTIRKALQTGNKEAIDVLKNIEGDFKNIGQLFEESRLQKNELIKEKLKAEEGDKLKSAFLSNLSHEIRTPMNAIVGFADLLLNTTVEREEQIEYLTVIDKSGKNLIAIIDDLIEMSKIESHQVKPNYAAVNIETCLNDLYKGIKITNKKAKKINFELIKPNNIALHPIKTDEVKLKQIITNFITNALKFTDKGTVSFGYEVESQNNQIKFFIKDTGFGISDEDQKYIFDRFRRVGGDQSIKAGGLGLGLSISKAYVELLGGTIALASKLNKGTTFSFTIPLEYIEAKKIQVQSIKNLAIEKGDEEGTILIAEDDNINFLLFQKIMKATNYKIIRAENGHEAVDICISNPNIGLVLMDIKMPVMDGFEALEKIAPIRPNLPIIAQTAFSSNEDKDKIFNAGFSNYITKPINREHLFELINEVFSTNK